MEPCEFPCSSCARAAGDPSAARPEPLEKSDGQSTDLAEPAVEMNLIP